MPRAFRQSILRALDQMGGSGRRPDVLERVQEIMQGRLNAADRRAYMPNPSVLVWQQSADEARYNLANKGLIKRPPDVPSGIWELTRAGEQEALK